MVCHDHNDRAQMSGPLDDRAAIAGATAAEIAAQVRSGSIEPREVVRQYLDRIAELDPAIGAFRVVRAEQALAEADAVGARADRSTLPLAGVPIAIKDNIEVAGEQTRSGSAATDPAANPADHPVVARLRAAGAVVVGLTNVPELCLVPMCDSAFGIARNPWDLGRTPGGSSGGSAAAVSAGLVPLAHGNDGLGSIRIPAACCGLVGIKPGTGVVPVTLDGEPAWDGLTENGSLATTVQDAALGLAAMAGDASLAELGDPGTVRVGVSLRSAQIGLPIDPQFIAATRKLAVALFELGHQVAPHTVNYPVWLGAAALRSWYSFAYDTASVLDPARLDLRTRRMAAAGHVLDTLHSGGAGARAKWRGGAADRFFGGIDVLVLPALSQPAPAAERWGEKGLLRNSATSMRTASLFGAWNIAGWPAMNVPAGVDGRGMPIGAQLVARPGGERLLLELAAQLETARPWPRLAPNYRFAEA
jgi:amidase